MAAPIWKISMVSLISLKATILHSGLSQATYRGIHIENYLLANDSAHHKACTVRDALRRSAGQLRSYSSIHQKTVAQAPKEGASSDGDKKISKFTEDGVIKRSGLLIDKYTMFDGTPVYPGKYKKIKVKAGTAVRAGMTLVQQKRLDFHPGLYVGIGRDLTLYAYEDGVVYITCEKLNLNLSRNLVRRFYENQSEENLYKMHYHVIPEPQQNRFKLLDQS